eukprot:362796-Chlamydomonas_euryale.AAC.3
MPNFEPPLRLARFRGPEGPPRKRSRARPGNDGPGVHDVSTMYFRVKVPFPHRYRFQHRPGGLWRGQQTLLVRPRLTPRPCMPEWATRTSVPSSPVAQACSIGVHGPSTVRHRGRRAAGAALGRSPTFLVSELRPSCDLFRPTSPRDPHIALFCAPVGKRRMALGGLWRHRTMNAARARCAGKVTGTRNSGIFRRARMRIVGRGFGSAASAWRAWGHVDSTAAAAKLGMASDAAGWYYKWGRSAPKPQPITLLRRRAQRQRDAA